jgi:hypothetical protein
MFNEWGDGTAIEPFQSYDSTIKTPQRLLFSHSTFGFNQRGTGQPPIRLFIYKCKLVLYFIIEKYVLLFKDYYIHDDSADLRTTSHGK